MLLAPNLTCAVSTPRYWKRSHGRPHSVSDSSQNAVERKQVDVVAAITRLFKQLLRLLPAARGRRRTKSASSVCPYSCPHVGRAAGKAPEVRGVGVGSVFFPRVGSGR
ncbi:hypothetical protein GCM10022232_84630 [Streptomyces plumbiresistens]|uniref:Uncharacterized protein n=1 Tax=Streptomyces plumbiresistens TaxID=511811 RepID=A0ABP7TH63_9ACTN